MRHRISTVVTQLPVSAVVSGALFAACASYSTDSNLLQGGAVDAQALTARMRCPRGASVVHGQTMGVETAMWCEKPGGIKHGPFVEWYENHQKKTAGEYIEGLRNGAWAFFLPNGQLDTRITYDNGAAVSTEPATPGGAVPMTPPPPEMTPPPPSSTGAPPPPATMGAPPAASPPPPAAQTPAQTGASAGAAGGKPRQ